MRILIVEDDSALRSSLVTQFSAAGFNVDSAADGEEALYCGREYPLDLAIIDLGLPKLPGMEVIRRLRAEGKSFPVLILTARDQWQDKVEGLQAGADDYVVKPFHFPEVLARVQALLRRATGWTQSVMQADPIALDTRTQTVTVSGTSVELTGFEYLVLEHLMYRAGEIVSKTDLIERLYAQDYDRESNTIEVFIGRLRRKLDPEDTYRPIETLRGRGYRFTLERKAAQLGST